MQFILEKPQTTKSEVIYSLSASFLVLNQICDFCFKQWLLAGEGCLFIYDWIYLNPSLF
jgi:hypothetical protein